MQKSVAITPRFLAIKRKVGIALHNTKEALFALEIQQIILPIEQEAFIDPRTVWTSRIDCKPVKRGLGLGLPKPV